jgi:hypothetical protein
MLLKGQGVIEQFLLRERRTRERQPERKARCRVKDVAVERRLCITGKKAQGHWQYEI